VRIHGAANTELPAIFISVGYRLIPTVSFPTPVMDCITAVRWIADHIAQHGGSPDRLFVGGHSAGGQIAALMTLRKDWLAEGGLPVDTIKGCFCLATTFNRRMIRPDIAPNDVQPGSPTDVAPDSPLTLAASATVPFFIAWGGRDGERMERTGRLMIGALTATGCRVQSLVLPQRPLQYPPQHSAHRRSLGPASPQTDGGNALRRVVRHAFLCRRPLIETTLRELE
jgi:arylformamidase